MAFKVTLPARDEDVVIASLWEHGTMGIEVRPGGPGEALLIAYFPARAGLEEDLRGALARLPDVRLESERVLDVDWVARVREGFGPFTVHGFRVVPAWEHAGDSPLTTIRIDPGRAFGTGTHESTQLCLAALRELEGRRGLGRVLDLGAGTAILAIAAALSGARPVVAVDHDPDALDSAALHSRLNGVEILLCRADLGTALAPASFDTVLANLSSRLLLERHREIVSLCSRGGALVLAGFLLEDLPALEDAYRPVGALRVRAHGEWAALLVLPSVP